MKLTGVGASEGVIVGPAFVHTGSEPEPERERIAEDEVEAELARFGRAVEAVVGKLAQTGERLRAVGSETEAGIFDAHVELAEDPELASGVAERVRNLQSPEAAVLAVGEEYAAELAAVEDEYLAARADDVRDVASQVAAELTGRGPAALEALETPSVVVARSLAPSDTARIPKGMALGFVTAEGSRTSHVSIMARSMGIPAVVGVGPALEGALNATTVAVNGTEGYAVTDPDEATVAEFERMSRTLAEERATLDEYRHVEARTRDGSRQRTRSSWGRRALGCSGRSSCSWSGRSCRPRKNSTRRTARSPGPSARSRSSFARWTSGGTRICPVSTSRRKRTRSSGGGAFG